MQTGAPTSSDSATARIDLLCGLPGSGKSTWAARRAAAGAVVLNPDRWMIRLHGHHMPRAVFDARLEAVFALLFEQAAEFARRGHDVVIDAGFWTRAQRRAAFTALRNRGAELRLLWFDVPPAELRRRLAERNAALPPDTFEITDAMLAEFAARFEPPAPDEGIPLERRE